LGTVSAVLAGLLSRLLQLALPFHLRPLYTVDLHLTWPIGVGSDLNHWNCFPSDHAALFFAFATLICMNDRRLGAVALFWAAIMSATRIYLGYHYPTDVIGGAALGVCLAIISKKVSFPRWIYRVLEWERYSPSSFYALAFIASYQAGTLFGDVRSIGHFLWELLLRHPI
jgi:membrane-associated phospholipid phosphatase